MTLFYTLLQLGMWALFSSTHKHDPFSGVVVVMYLVGAATAVYNLIAAAKDRSRDASDAVLLVIQVMSYVLAVFSLLYYAIGTAKNFSSPLSHTDAFYFALGTLSTAGTGNIVAISEDARGLQTYEMLTGIGLVLF